MGKYGGIRIKTTIDRGLARKIEDAVYEACMEVLYQAKERMLSSPEQPNEWSNTGGMHEQLKAVGLDQHIKAGSLLRAWTDTILDIKVDRNYRHITMNIFNTKKLNDATRWVGLSAYPFFINTQDEKEGTWTTEVTNNPTLLYGDKAYRPISAGENKPWIWGQNPYPGYGYWILYEQGAWDYDPRPFIVPAYREMLGMYAGNLLDGGEVKFDEDFLKKLEAASAKAAQRNVNK
jgi:hypothetical protein